MDESVLKSVILDQHEVIKKRMSSHVHTFWRMTFAMFWLD